MKKLFLITCAALFIVAAAPLSAFAAVCCVEVPRIAVCAPEPCVIEIPRRVTKTISFENVNSIMPFAETGTFQGTGTPPLIRPGEQTQIRFSAGRGQALSFVTMYGNSKDLFFAPENPGLTLFDANGNAVTGDVSSQVKLWDNGSFLNSDPSHPVSQQSSVAENINIREVASSDGMYSYPAASEMMKLSLAYNDQTSEFTLTIRNNSNNTSVQTPFSPGVWTISNVMNGRAVSTSPLFRPEQRTNPELTAIATSGNNQPFANLLREHTGVVTGLSPVMVVVYTGNQNPLFSLNQMDSGRDLANIAQAGNAEPLKNWLKKQWYVRDVFILGTADLVPGAEVSRTFEMWDNDNIAFATMFGSSNDWFYANSSPITAESTGDITHMVRLYDDGTATSQYPGAGNRQPGFANQPVSANRAIRVVDTQTYPDYQVPSVDQVIKVTIR